MGTNYYLESGHQPNCPTCLRPFENKVRHIGKSSAGWVFALHIYPDAGINDLPDWVESWTTPGMVIKDEYGRTLTPDEMLSCILGRFGMRSVPMKSPEWYWKQGAEPGPWGLARAKLDGQRIIGHGLGTYALHVGPEDSW